MAIKTMYPGINNSPKTALTSEISATAQTIRVADISVFPSPPNLATIGTDDSAEVIRYNGISGSSLTGCERGFDGTTASVWRADAAIYRAFTKYDYETLLANITELLGMVNGIFPITSESEVTLSGLLKGADGKFAAATPGTDYVTPTQLSQKADASAVSALQDKVDGKAAKTVSIAISLLADGWTGDGPYTQTVSVAHLTGSRFENPDVFPEFTDEIEAEREAWNMVDQVVSVDGALEFTCFTEAPDMDLTLIVKVRD